MSSARLDRAAPREGFVYVLAAPLEIAGKPVIKIGMTMRAPEKRTAELSRGGPVGMRLIGAVSSVDAAKLERLAHQNYSRFRIVAGGGTEYFSVDPAEVLAWLREKSPRFEFRAAREAAWSEYTSDPRFKSTNGLALIPIHLSGVCLGICMFWHPLGEWMVYVGWPAGFVVGFAISLVLNKLMADDYRALEIKKKSLEEKYNLPPGGVRVPGGLNLSELEWLDRRRAERALKGR